MSTTIQISSEVRDVLVQLRHAFGVSSYNDVVQELVRKAFSRDKSMYGVLASSTRKKILDGLRDKNDKL